MLALQYDTRTPLAPTLITEALRLVAIAAAFNDCYSELTPYTALANS